MTELADPITNPPDICLLLRVHGEQRWLIGTVVPLVRQLEEPGAIAEEEVGPALSYLEVLWLEAGLRAIQTDGAREDLEAAAAEGTSLLVSEKARRYHAAVKRLREAVDRRVRRLTRPHEEQPAHQPASS